MSWLIQNGVFGETMMGTADRHELGVAFLGYLIFTLYMTYGAASTHKVLFFIFILIDLLFIGLSLSTLADIEFGHWLAAFAEFFLSMLSFYGSAAAVLNTHYGKIILPVGKPFIKR